MAPCSLKKWLVNSLQRYFLSQTLNSVHSALMFVEGSPATVPSPLDLVAITLENRKHINTSQYLCRSICGYCRMCMKFVMSVISGIALPNTEPGYVSLSILVSIKVFRNRTYQKMLSTAPWYAGYTVSSACFRLLETIFAMAKLDGDTTSCLLYKRWLKGLNNDTLGKQYVYDAVILCLPFWEGKRGLTGGSPYVSWM